MRVGAVVLLALSACGSPPRPAPPPAPPLVHVAVAPTSHMAEVQLALDEVVGARSCAFTWGRLPKTPPPAVSPIKILFGRGQVLSGWLFCEDDLEALVSDRSVREDAMVFWRDGALRMTHGSGMNESVPLASLPRRTLPVRGYAAFVPGERDPAVSELLPHLRDELPRAFRFALFFVGEDRD